MKSRKTNIVLIGMPGSGKSTTGVLLAKRLSLGFIDTDVLIQTVEKRPLQEIVDIDGYMELRRIEARVILGLECRDQVIATGGSAAYSAEAMAHLQETGTIIFLDTGIKTLLSRITDLATRGIARRPDQTFEDLFEERSALYKKYAEMTVQCGGIVQEAVCEKIAASLSQTGFGR
jgi:shikimate kinase